MNQHWSFEKLRLLARGDFNAATLEQTAPNACEPSPTVSGKGDPNWSLEGLKAAVRTHIPGYNNTPAAGC